MKTENLLLIAGGLYLLFKYRTAPPSVPGFVGPIQQFPQSSAGIPPAVNTPVKLPPITINTGDVTGTGLQNCMAPDGNTYFWKSSQGCPYADFAVDGVPYTIGADGNPMPLTY
jgi:hypothetical protein